MLQSHQSHSHGRDGDAGRRRGEIIARTPAFAPGEVWLVGAGSEDPGLLSPAAAQALGAADAVVFDSWIDPALLELAPAGCYLEARDRRTGDGGAIRRCIELAQQGWRVVRLMDGDPLAPGAGAGEALVLAEAEVAFRRQLDRPQPGRPAKATSVAAPLQFSMAGAG
jgi:precorrin-4 methylase